MKYKNLIKELEKIKKDEPNVAFIKIYYSDEENYTVKGIDENGIKVFTNRVNKDRKLKAFDCDYREKVGKWTSFNK